MLPLDLAQRAPHCARIGKPTNRKRHYTRSVAFGFLVNLVEGTSFDVGRPIISKP